MAATFKELLQGDELVRIFAVGRVVHPVVVDLFGLAGGFHGLWVDQEHCAVDYDKVQLACVCARANGFDTIVRMAPTDYALATQNLEAGAGGLMAARIESAEHAEQFVRWAKFAPRGERGLNVSGRDALYTHKAADVFASDSNRDSLVAIQIETRGALEDADKIAAIEGVDLLFVGPADLSQALGITGQFGHDDLWAAFSRVAEACKKHGKHWGTVAPNPDFVQRAVDLGGRMISFTHEVLALRRGIEAMKDAYGGFFP